MDTKTHETKITEADRVKASTDKRIVAAKRRLAVADRKYTTYALKHQEPAP
jgi:hypothetical protein